MTARAFAANEADEAVQRELDAIRRKARRAHGPEGLELIDKLYDAALMATARRRSYPPQPQLLQWAVDAYARGDVLC